MIKLFTQNLNNKFTNNILYLNDQDIVVSTGNTENILYKIHSKYNFNNYIFNTSLFNNEVAQFIAEYCSTIKIFIFHDQQPNIDILKEYEKFCINITQDSVEGFDTKIVPKNIVNDITYKNTSYPKDDSIVFFLDNLNEIPENIQNLLYPNTKLKIKLYNNQNIKHPQNIGMISENDKALILNKSSYFISYNEYYEQEASICGCTILDYNDLDLQKPKQVQQNYITYKQFLLDIL